ncbi:MAG: carbohydrate ABC transporter permease [Thermosynechococcaceae cyanobacterium]
MLDAENLSRILGALVAIVVGSGGVIALFYVMNALVTALPFKGKARLLPWVYISPALLVLTAYLVLPTIWTVLISFLDRRSEKFVGLDNYIFAFTDSSMLVAFRNNLLWLVLVTGVSVSLGLVIAVLVDKVKYEAFAKGLIFMPMAISFVGASVIWRFVYAYTPPEFEQIGLLNAILVQFGGEPIGWLINKTFNNFALIAIMIWLQTGFCMVLLSSAVKGIPGDVLEAARMDGANELQIFWRITIPMIRSTITVVATTVVVLVLKVFDIVFVMTGGRLDTDVIASRMIEIFPRDFGRGSAIAVILLIAVIPVMVVNIRRFRQQEISR